MYTQLQCMGCTSVSTMTWQYSIISRTNHTICNSNTLGISKTGKNVTIQHFHKKPDRTKITPYYIHVNIILMYVDTTSKKLFEHIFNKIWDSFYFLILQKKT